jgi:hypothetical protein
MAVADIDEVLAPEYLDGLKEWPLEKLRARRDRAEEVEFDRSFLRRMVQGRLDIVAAVRKVCRHFRGLAHHPGTFSYTGWRSWFLEWP